MRSYFLPCLLIFTSCGIAIVDPIPMPTESTGGASSVSSTETSAEASASSGESTPCRPGQFIPNSDGGPDGGLSLCCATGKTLCLEVCCQPDNQVCTGNFELGYCCPNDFVCLPRGD